MSYSEAATAIVAHIEAIPEWAQVRTRHAQTDLDTATLTQIIGAAGDLAHDVLAPFNRAGDAVGCRLVDGRVQLAPGHHAAWQAYREGGWTTIDAPAAHGGAGLPVTVHAACEELVNRAAPAFGMLPTPMRCATMVLVRYAAAAIVDEWVPHLVDGSWAATICISEPDAGSDVGRVRTMATPQGDGTWRVTGEKIWISFGDHDLAPRIGHMVLARTPGGAPGTAGLSLFLVPSDHDGKRNGVVVRRIEEKLGLHASPTCALGFEDAHALLVGTEARGLPQLFAMIVGMRLSVGSQGAGIAGAAAELAAHYASERHQGGKPDRPAVPIASHPDVRRMLQASAARAEVARGLVLTASVLSDLQDDDPDAAALVAWLLPITKTFCAEAASLCADQAIQVLGGAGYTREWPAEQYLRDARVLAIYEGTSGMQALDLVMRRVLGDEARPLRAFLTRARHDAEAAGGTALATMLDRLERAAASLDRTSAPTVAYPFLQLAALTTTAWIATRLLRHCADLKVARNARHWLKLATIQSAAEADLVALGEDLLTQ
jgi:3-(methylthio)propanoyl-CoA dehydrogenase